MMLCMFCNVRTQPIDLPLVKIESLRKDIIALRNFEYQHALE